MIYRILPMTFLCATASAMTLVGVSAFGFAFAVDAPTYEESAAYIQDKGTVEEIRLNEYYDPTKTYRTSTNIKREIHRKIRFPEHCVMELVSEHFSEVAPPSDSGLDNKYGLTEREFLTVDLAKVFPSQIYVTQRPSDSSAVIIKARKGGISTRTELYYDHDGNENIYGVPMNVAEENSVDSRFGRLECTAQTCTRSRSFNGYGIGASDNEYTDGLREALGNMVELCGGTG